MQTLTFRPFHNIDIGPDVEDPPLPTSGITRSTNHNGNIDESISAQPKPQYSRSSPPHLILAHNDLGYQGLPSVSS